MRRSILFLAALLVMSPALVFAQATDLDTWIDTDFDGLPANAIRDVGVGVYDSFAIWVDLTGYTDPNWTNFLYAIALGPGPDTSAVNTKNWFAMDSIFIRTDATGSLYPTNNFESEYVVQFGGVGFNETVISGPYRLGVVRMLPIRPSAVGAACVVPQILGQNPAYLFCQFGTGATYGLFNEGTVTPGCFTITGDSPVDATSWGKLKGLYK